MATNRYMRWLAGAALTLALTGAATLALTGTASAQTPPTTATAPAQAATTPVPGAPGTGAPNGAMPGGRGGRSRGGPGMDGPGPGGMGATTTADGATQAISSTTATITRVKGDLTYATGKMDTANVASWLAAADKWLAQAQAAQTGGQYGQAGAYAQAARAVADTAEQAMAQALGADKLPSYSQQSAQGGMHGPKVQGQTATAPTQASASRELQRTYNAIVSQGALVGTNSDAASYLTQAQNAYKTAYTAYQAGDYTAAHNAAHQAESLLRVVNSLLRVSDAGVSPDAPVTVPAPTF